MSDQAGQYALELWSAENRVYTPAADSSNPRILYEAAKRIGARAWRIVAMDKARPARPVYRYSRGGNVSGRDSQAIVCDYLAWAKRVGLASVAVYDKPQHGVKYAKWAEGLMLRIVPVADFLGHAPQPETEE